MNKELIPLPVHSLSENQFPVYVKEIQHKNPYDFTREHRHTYFEIFFFENGGGSQLIDFIEIPVKANSCYIVFPQQVHLLKRGPEASGLLIQFSEEIIPSVKIKNLLQQILFQKNNAVIFENNPQKLKDIYHSVLLLKDRLSNSSNFSSDIALNYLQAILLQVIESRETVQNTGLSDETRILLEFQKLLEEQFLKNHLVKNYTLLINCSEKKLAIITKKHFGLTPLQIIHNRILLEAKRILLFESTQHKEIAFHLGFDSPASFSQFIKNKTGYNPSELYTRLVNIHKQ